MNRTRSTAEALADDLGTAQAAGLDELPRLLGRARVVIVATGAPEPVLSEALVRDARAARGARAGTSPLLVIDVSVPRNIEGAVGRLPGVELIDLDSLFPEAAETERSRRAAIPEAEAIVEASVGEFGGWLELLAARRALRPLQELLAEVCRREVSHLAGESDSSRRTADRIVASVMARPMSALRSASQRGESVEEAAGALGGLFARTSPD